MLVRIRFRSRAQRKLIRSVSWLQHMLSFRDEVSSGDPHSRQSSAAERPLGSPLVYPALDLPQNRSSNTVPRALPSQDRRSRAPRWGPWLRRSRFRLCRLVSVFVCGSLLRDDGGCSRRMPASTACVRQQF